MGKAGRKPIVEKSKQREVFMKYADKLLDVKLRDPIFDTIASDLDNLMTPAALYMSLKRNFREFLNTECKQQTVCLSSSSLSSSSSNSPRTSSKISHSHVESNQHHSENDTKNFKFELDIYDWKKLQPLNVLYKRNDLRTCTPFKKYKILPKYKWVDILREKIWLISRLPCTWNFKSYKVESEHHILVKGQCSQCSAFTKIACQKITDNIIEGQCQITVGEKNKKHDPRKKYRMNALVRRKLAKKLKHDSASLVHKQLAAKMSKQGITDTAPVIPTLNALRKIKYEERKRMWLHNNVILSILTMAVTKPIFLRDIHFFPRIHIYYWTDEQQQYCREYQSCFQRLTITLDATGSIFQPLKLPNGYELSKRLFLYVIILINQFDVCVPLCQMITDSHDTASVSAWLLQWLKNVRCHPDEVITDDSSALVAANVRTFSDFTCVKDYLLRCFSILNGNKEELPKTFIRLDTSHFIKTLYNLNCFENVDTKIKMYYIHCIRYIKECQDFALVKEIITKMIKLCLHQNDFENDDSGLKESKQNLDNLLNSHKYADFKNVDQNEEFEYDQIVIDDAGVRDIVAWFDLLVDNEKKSNPANSYVGKSSSYYLPLFIPTLKRLFIKLPLWSNVMCSYFKSETLNASSSCVESYFRTLKQLVFKTKIARQRIDEYLQHHYDYIKGELHLALNQLKNLGSTTLLKSKSRRTRRAMTKNIYKKEKVNPKKQIQQKQKELYFSSDSIFSDRPSYLENWRGESNTHNRLKKDDEIVIIRNGNLALKESSGYFNTCAFDSAFYLIGQACIRSSAFKSFLSELKGDCVINYIFMLLNGAHDIEQIYNCRSEITKTFFQNKDCSCNVAYIFEKIFIKYFTSAQYLKTCTNCNYIQLKRDHVFILINLDILKLFGISSLEEAICFDEKINTMCQKCDTQLKGELKLGEIITFDLNGAADSVLLTELPITINIKDNYYFLVGTIEFIPGTKIGHYKCHFLNNNTYFCYDDNSFKIDISTSKKICLHSVSYIRVS